MEKRAIDVAQALARLSELTIFELRGEWRRLHRMPPPMRLLDIRPSRSRPDRGVAVVRSLTRNQQNEVVQRLTAKLIVPRRV